MQSVTGMCMAPDNTFGEGFDWETAPWFDANGLNDVAPMQASTVLESYKIKVDKYCKVVLR